MSSYQKRRARVEVEDTALYGEGSRVDGEASSEHPLLPSSSNVSVSLMCGSVGMRAACVPLHRLLLAEVAHEIAERLSCKHPHTPYNQNGHWQVSACHASKHAHTPSCARAPCAHAIDSAAAIYSLFSLVCCAVEILSSLSCYGLVAALSRVAALGPTLLLLSVRRSRSHPPTPPPSITFAFLFPD